MDLETTLTNSGKEVEGVWVPFGADGEILVGRMYTDRWNAIYRRITRPVRRQIGNDEEMARRMLIETLAEASLLGWKNLRVDGKEVKYSKEKAKELMTQYPVLREAVVEAATEVTNYQDTEEDLGN